MPKEIKYIQVTVKLHYASLRLGHKSMNMYTVILLHTNTVDSYQERNIPDSSTNHIQIIANLISPVDNPLKEKPVLIESYFDNKRKCDVMVN